VGATGFATRLDTATAPTLPRIPVVAIAWAEARHLLEAIDGAEAPAAFRGGIPIPYRLGPGPARARVDVAMNDGLRPITNVIGTIRGTTQPDRVIMLGGHHDAWTFGGVDPGTGAAVLLEVARVLGRLAREGVRPARSVSIAFWDAEEFGLVGSTEYAEQWRRQLQEQLVLYVNTDMYMKGRLDAGGVPSLRDFVADVVRDVPEGNRTVLDGWRDAARRSPSCASAACEPELKALGSGADFVAFQDHIGVPTLSVEFIGANGYGYGTYHSNYDSRAYVERIADPGFAQGAVLAQVLGTLAVRMANADVLPFRFGPYAMRLDAATASAEEWLRGGGGALSVFLKNTMRERARRLFTAAELDGAIDRRLARGPFAPNEARQLNDLLARMEQLLTDDDGAPDRAWYRHVVHGWNIYSLYDGQPFPGLAEAVRLQDPARVGKEVERIERAFERLEAAVHAARLIAAGEAR
jgi:N-acetylated-alpha-linked acidic dipeptidase